MSGDWTPYRGGYLSEPITFTFPGLVPAPAIVLNEPDDRFRPHLFFVDFGGVRYAVIAHTKGGAVGMVREGQ